MAPEPEWADPLPCPNSMDPAAATYEDGVLYLLSDEFDNIPEKAYYGQFIRQIVNEAGVENGSEIRIGCDPSYEVIELHKVDVHRDGKWSHRLKNDVVSVLRRESDLDRHMLNGRHTVTVHLEDIRPGDLISYSFSRRGGNPIMAGHFHTSIDAGFSSPLRTMRYRVLSDGREMQIKNHETTLQPIRRGNLLEWQATDLPVILEENAVPKWATVYPWIEVGDMKDWGEVVKWALPLYEGDHSLPPELEREIQRIAALPTDDERVSAALRFVQDAIRYLGVEVGANGYRPRTPREVFAKRYGDCKEKALLLTSLLHRLGIDSEPVLVSSNWERGVNRFLPSPHAFDHVIVRVHLGREEFFIDPTRTSQRGPLRQIYLPNYGFGLPILPGVTELVKVAPRPESTGGESITESFVVGDRENVSPTTLTVVTRSTGASAEAVRGQFAESSAEHIQKDYLSFYAVRFPGIKSTALPVFKDDEATNSVSVTESYEIGEAWQKDDSGTGRTLSFVQRDLLTRLALPGSTNRKWAFALSYPNHFDITTSVTLPEKWGLKPFDELIENRFFHFSYNVQSDSDRAFTIKGRYRALCDEVQPSSVPDYERDARKARDAVGYELTHSGAAAEKAPTGKAGWRPNWILLEIILVTIAVTTVGCWRVLDQYRGRPPMFPPAGLDARPGFAGWLILLAISVCLSPLNMLVQSVSATVPLTNAVTWDLFAKNTGAYFHPLWAWLFGFEAMGNVTFTVLRAFVALLFLRKSRLFPWVFAIVQAGNILFLVADSASLALIPHDKIPEGTPEQSSAEVGKMIVGSLIWVPYVFLSKRVRATFLR